MKTLKITVSALFFAFVVLVGALQFTDITFTAPINENRDRTPLPQGSLLINIWDSTANSTRYEDYFNDNYALRDLLIKSKNQIDFTLFGRSDDLYLADDGVLILKSELNNEITNQRISDADFARLCALFEEVTLAMEDKGVDFYIMLAPLQNTVYPQLTENSGVWRPEETRFHQLMEYLLSSDITGSRTVDTLSVLEFAEEFAPTYYKTDFHWTHVAAAWTFNDLIETVSANRGLNFHWLYDINPVAVDDYQGHQTDNLAKFRLPAEYDYRVQKYWGDQLLREEISGVYHTHYTSAEEGELLPKAMIIGNSYILHFAEQVGLYEHFSEACFYHSNLIPDMEELEEGTEIVVLQFLEMDMRMFESYLNSILNAL